MQTAFNPNYQPTAGDVLLIGGRLKTVLAAQGRQLSYRDTGSGAVDSGYYNPVAGIVSSAASGAALFTTSAGSENTGTCAITATAINHASAFDSSRGPYTIACSSSATKGKGGALLNWTVTDANGTAVPSGGPNPVTFMGVSIALTGTPAVGDTFTVTPWS